VRRLSLLVLLACFALACDDDSTRCGTLIPCSDDGRHCPGEDDDYFCWWFGFSDDDNHYCCATYEQACQHACVVEDCGVIFTMPPQPGCE